MANEPEPSPGESSLPENGGKLQSELTSRKEDVDNEKVSLPGRIRVFQSLINSQGNVVDGELEDFSMPEVARTTPEQQLTTNQLRDVLNPGSTITTVTGYSVKMVEDDQGRLLFQSRCLNETATSVGQPQSPSTRKTLTSFAGPPASFARIFGLVLCPV
jgi:hypothetical protein